MAKIVVTNTHPQPHVTQNDDGTLTLHLETATGSFEVTMSKAQALGIGAVLVDKSAASILWSIADAQQAQQKTRPDLSTQALERITRKGDTQTTNARIANGTWARTAPAAPARTMADLENDF